tara:strand:- start:285 stop:698 length:414 start_codon:yes stop_codon:yes gene_type:complete
MIQEQNKPPKNVLIGVNVLIIALGLGIIRAIIGIPMLEDPIAIRIAVIIAVPFVLLAGFLIYKIYREKNWARIIFLVLFIVGVIGNIDDMILWFFEIQILLVLYIIETIATIIALFLILQEKSSKRSGEMNTLSRTE